MYNSPRRRGGSNELADVHARQEPAESRTGAPRDFLRRHERETAEAVRGTANQRLQYAACFLKRTADPLNIKAAIDHLASEAGNAPGPGGRTFEDLDFAQRWELARVLGVALSEGTYRPGPEREKEIPKPSGRGTRTLRIQDIEDRVVQRAIVQIIQPFLDPLFAATSFGYRPGMGRGHALAAAEHLATKGDRWTWATDDISDAFDHVPHGRLLDVVRKTLGAGGMTELIRVDIENERGMGLRQGGSLSPILLNTYLDHVLDWHWKSKRPDTPTIRYADDLLILTKGTQDAEFAHAYLESRLRSAGMALKGDRRAAIHDLRTGQPVEWLGIAIRRGPGGLEYRPAERSWETLREDLGIAHTKPESPIRAIETIEGWIGQLGPCRRFLDIPETHARIATLAAGLAFEEFPSHESVEQILNDAHGRWDLTRRRTSERIQGMDDGGSAKPAFFARRSRP
jgi:hypothetical protein